MGWSSYLGHYLFFIHKILGIECMCLLYTTFHHPPVVLYIAFIHWYLPLRWTPFLGTYKFLYLDIKVYTIFCPLHCSPLSPSHFKSVPTFHPPFPIFFFFFCHHSSSFVFPVSFSLLFFLSSSFHPLSFPLPFFSFLVISSLHFVSPLFSSFPFSPLSPSILAHGPIPFITQSNPILYFTFAINHIFCCALLNSFPSLQLSSLRSHHPPFILPPLTTLNLHCHLPLFVAFQLIQSLQSVTFPHSHIYFTDPLYGGDTLYPAHAGMWVSSSTLSPLFT